MPSAPSVARRFAPVLLGVGLLALAYLGAYAGARLSHRLVFNGHEVVGAHATRGPPGFTTWELVFLPLVIAEGLVR